MDNKVNYIITAKSEQHPNVVLQNTTKVDDKIEWNDNFYRVKEIIIVNPDENIIELRCINVTNKNKKPLIRRVANL
ncbi:hypothetical protein [Aestuariibaculum lutulentum]|uniref:Head-tail adaptor protein n=1 Tax=Aestuariibaculum lutulentum TaxID=2920935 RepID=A0ABS9RKT8_9FLAO|nr:hypothetical protein [Aestuariibaculum lutulentum]MCH4553562.1 hypothetical protein [Aestuariibaculum lutulentum]